MLPGLPEPLGATQVTESRDVLLRFGEGSPTQTSQPSPMCQDMCPRSREEQIKYSFCIKSGLFLYFNKQLRQGKGKVTPA